MKGFQKKLVVATLGAILVCSPLAMAAQSYNYQNVNGNVVLTPMIEYQRYAPINTSVKNPAKAKRIKELSKGLKVVTDSMSNATYYFPKKNKADPLAFYPVVVVYNDNNTVGLEWVSKFMTTSIAMSNMFASYIDGPPQWLFFDRVQTRVGGRMYEIRYNLRNQSRQIITAPTIAILGSAAASSSIVECYEEAMDANGYDIFKAMKNSSDEEINIRFISSSQNLQVDDVIDKKRLATIRQLYDLYEVFKS